MRRRPETAWDLDRSLGGDAGDITPTFVTPADAQRYIDEVDTGYTVLDLAIAQSSVSSAWQSLWRKHLEGWTTFRDRARHDLSWLNARATMEQTDRWSNQLGTWSADFKAQGGGVLPPTPTGPGQGMPSDTKDTLANLAQIAVILGGVAALFVIARELK